MIPAGRRRARVTFQSFTETQDGYGEPIRTWTNLATTPSVWAEKVDLSGDERFQAQQTEAEVETRWTILYRSDLTAKMRLVHDSVNHDIKAVLDPTGRKDELQILTARSAN